MNTYIINIVLLSILYEYDMHNDDEVTCMIKLSINRPDQINYYCWAPLIVILNRGISAIAQGFFNSYQYV